MVNAAQLSSSALYFAASAMLTSIVSVSIDTWEITNTIPSSGNFRRGLWRACENEICDRLPDTKFLLVVRVFMLLGVLGLTLSVVVQVVAGRVVSSSAVLTHVGTMGPFIAGLCCMIAFAVYKDNIKVTSSGKECGSGFVLAIVSWILAWLSAFLGYYRKSSDGSEETKREVSGVSNVTYSTAP